MNSIRLAARSGPAINPGDLEFAEIALGTVRTSSEIGVREGLERWGRLKNGGLDIRPYVSRLTESEMKAALQVSENHRLSLTQPVNSSYFDAGLAALRNAMANRANSP